MGQDQWTAVDGYFGGHFAPHDEVLDAAQREAERAGLPSISVSAPQGKFLHLLARLTKARRILEIGTLGGYSTIWLARALPDDGELVTLEADPDHAEVARRNLDQAELSSRVDVRVGPALDTLPELTGEGPFDLTFIDADKVNNTRYVRWALDLSRPGSVIVVDNVVRRGAVADADSNDPAVRGTREMAEYVAGEPRLDATALQTVGEKGYDGLALLLVTD